MTRSAPELGASASTTVRLGASLRRHRYHAALGALAAGLACAPAPLELALIVAAVAALAASALAQARLAVGAAALVLGSSLAGDVRLEEVEPPALRPLADGRVERLATLLEHPRRSRFGFVATVRIRAGPKVLARSASGVRWPPGAGPGSELLVAGRLAAPRSSAGAAFDWPRELRRRGISAELTLERVSATGRRRGGIGGAVDRVRERAEHALMVGAAPAHAALVRGMVLGQDEAIAPHVREDFRRSGLAHLTAVSGQNVALLCSLALPLVAVLGLGPRARALALMALIALYVPLAGAGPSLQRAAVMGGAGLAALLAGRASSRWYALGLAAVVTLALDPRVCADVGWQLSFAAVAGIMVLGPRLRPPLRGLPRPLAEGIALTVAATLATAPLLAHHFGTVSVVGLGANVLALPAVAPIMWLGMIQAASGQALAVAPESALVGAVIAALGALNSVPLDYLEALAARAAIAPGADLAVDLDGRLALVGGYALLAAATLTAGLLGRRLGPRSAEVRAAFGRAPRAARVAGGLAIASLLAALALAPAAAPDRLTVSFQSVPNGSGSLPR